MVAFCGEPSHYGDRIAALPKRARRRGRAAVARADARRTEARRRTDTITRAGARRHRLEQVVDVHAFTPAELERHAARRRASKRCSVSGEELVAGLVRLGQPDARGDGRARSTCRGSGAEYAYRGYLLLQTLDRSLLEPRLPAGDLLQPADLRARAGLAQASRARSLGTALSVEASEGPVAPRGLRSRGGGSGGTGSEGGRLADHPGEHRVEESLRPLRRLRRPAPRASAPRPPAGARTRSRRAPRRPPWPRGSTERVRARDARPRAVPRLRRPRAARWRRARAARRGARAGAPRRARARRRGRR